MKRIVISLVLILSTYQVLAQSFEEDLQRRYFLSRNRLKKWFVTADGMPGNGYPTEQIKLAQNQFDYPFDRVLLKPNGIDSVITNSAWNLNEEINRKNTEVTGTVIGDNPLIMLGEYLQVLSTEYWLLQYYKQTNTESFAAVKNEIYYALLAIDRLDKSCENYFDKTILTSRSDINGFLRRDDSDFRKIKRVNDYFGKFANMHGNIQNSNLNNIEGPVSDTSFVVRDSNIIKVIPILVRDSIIYDTIYEFGSTDNNTIDTINIGIWRDSFIYGYKDVHKYYRNNYRINTNVIADPNRNDKLDGKCDGRLENEASMDEFIGLFSGLRYVQKFVDEDAFAKPTDQDSLKYLVNWTREIANRMMQYITQKTTDVRVLQPADYTRKQQLKCVLDRKDRKTMKKVRNEEMTLEDACPECANKDIYTAFTPKNPIIFSEANYVLTNPTKGGRHVARGPYAFVFGGGIEKLGENLASSSTNSKDYPGVSLVLDNNAILTLGGANVVAGIFFNPVLQIPFAGYTGIDFFIDDKKRWDNLISEIFFRCYPLTVAEINGISLCLMGSDLRPDKDWYWRQFWNKLGDSTTGLNKLWLKYASESGSPNVMAAKIAACNGDWDNRNFENFVSTCGFPMMSLQYDILNDKQPIKDKGFYEDILNTMDCWGSKGNGWPFDRDALGGHAMRPSMRNKNFYDDGSFGPQTGFMLYYNLYRIAQIKWWGDSIGNFVDNGCPCYVDSFQENMQLPFSVIEPKRKVYERDVNGEKEYSIFYHYLNSKKQLDSIFLTKDANPRHVDGRIRNPEYLNHYYELGANQKFGITRDLVICNAQLNCKNKGEVFIKPSSNPNSPNEIIIRKNGELLLGDNAVLRINNNSRMVVEEGGKLSYKQGARIILDGPNAVLHIKGILEIGSNAFFKIEGGPNGKGYIIWENNWNSKTNNNTAKLISNTNSSVLLENANSGQLTLKIIGNGGFNTNWNLAQFKIKKARVDLGPEAYLMCESQYTILDSVEVHGFMDKSDNPLWNYTPCSRGIHIMGVKNQFSRITIYDCKEGIVQRDLVGVHEPLKLVNVDFVNCLSAITNHGGKIQYQNGNIGNSGYKQLRNGIGGIGTQGNSVFQNINIHLDYFNNDPNCGYPLGSGETVTNFWNHGTSRNFFTNCTIASAKNGAVLNQSYLIARCSYFSNNINQITMFQNSLFNANNTAWNRFYWNTSSADKKFLTGRNGVFVYLDKGSNYIMGHQDNSSSLFIDADLHYTHPLFASSRASGGNNLAVNATNNEWAIGGIGGLSTLMSSNSKNINFNNASVFGANYDINYTPVFNGNHIASRDNACNGKVINYDWWPIDSILVSRANASGYNGSLIKLRADSLKYELENSPKDYTSIITKAKILFNTPLPDDIGGDIIEIYSTIQSAYLDVFTDSTIPTSSKNAIKTAVYTGMLDLQQNLIDQADGPNQRLWQLFRFEVHRDFALIHRVFNNRPTAINYLNQVLPTFSKPSDVVSLEAWRCLIEKEQAYLDSLIPYWQISLDTCLIGLEQALNNDSISTEWMPDWKNRYKGGESSSQFSQTLNTSKEESNSTKLNYRISPNPTTGICLIESDELIIQCKVYNSSGKQILSFEPKSKVFQFDLSSSPKGIYIVKSTTKLGVNSSKIIVQ
jgi:hypothetical protein